MPAIVRTAIDDSSIASINSQLTRVAAARLRSIILIDYELHQHSDLSVLARLKPYDCSPKILLSMMPERGIASQIIAQFDGFLAKPLDVGYLVSELTRLSQSPSKPLFYQDSTRHPVESHHLLGQIKDAHLASESTEQSIATHPDATLNAKSNPGITSDSDSKSSPLILVAEDQPMNQKVACKMLEKLGYRTMVANNGEEAIRLLEQHRPQIGLILMDCRMPILDGISATKTIRSDQDTIPIIALTANDSEEDQLDCLQAGMDGFLAKPLKKDKLCAMLARFLPAQ